jgi:hypothetical protein
MIQMGLRPFINSSLARKQDERSLPVYYPYIGEGRAGMVIMRWILYVLIVLVAVISGGWAALALWYQAPGGPVVRAVAAVAWVIFVLTVLALIWAKRGGVPIAAYVLAYVILLAWWGTISPSNHREWADDVSRMLAGQVDGNRVTLFNVRNFNWRTDDDYDARWETRSYDLDQLSTADVILSSWGVPGISHALISFGFNDGSHVVFSVEIRRRKGQSFSSIGGFFKQFESTIIAADEHDIIRVRTNVRNETDHLYRLRMDKAAMRSLFLAYVQEANELGAKPAFYNTVTSNCVTIVYGMAKRIDPGLPYDYRLLLTSYLPSYLYQVGALDTQYPLAVLTQQGDITARARATTVQTMTSRAPYAHLPNPDAMTPQLPPLRAVGEGWGGVKPSILRQARATPPQPSPACRGGRVDTQRAYFTVKVLLLRSTSGIA